MIKYLVVIGVVVGIYYFFIKKKPIASPHTNEKKQKKETKESNDMVECASCGIYCEIDEAIISSGKYYCSNECVTKG